MTTELDVSQIRQKTRLALHQDGLDEIMVGLSLGIMAVFFLDFRFSIALIAGCAIQILAKPACRKRITYPRVGYARLPEATDKAARRAILALAIGAVFVGLGLFFVSQLRWLLPSYLGVVLAGVTIAQVWKNAHIYDYFIVGLFLASGVVGLLLVALGCEPGVAAAIQGWALAAFLVPVGMIRLGLFLRRYGKKNAKEASCGSQSQFGRNRARVLPGFRTKRPDGRDDGNRAGRIC